MGNLESAAEEVEETVWGAPPTHDGHLYPVYPFYVDSISKIPKGGWEEILASKALTWAIIPWESSKEKK